MATNRPKWSAKLMPSLNLPPITQSSMAPLRVPTGVAAPEPCRATEAAYAFKVPSSWAESRGSMKIYVSHACPVAGCQWGHPGSGATQEGEEGRKKKKRGDPTPGHTSLMAWS